MVKLTNITTHTFKGKWIRQCTDNKYISGTDMCKIYNVPFNTFFDEKNSPEYLVRISMSANKSIEKLVFTNNNVRPLESGTWLHPLVAIEFARRSLTADLAAQIAEWSFPYIPNIALPNVSPPIAAETNSHFSDNLISNIEATERICKLFSNIEQFKNDAQIYGTLRNVILDIIANLQSRI